MSELKPLTDNEIIKALECCVSDGGCISTGCPMINECRIDIESAEKYALSLINRQKAELDRLREIEKLWNKLLTIDISSNFDQENIHFSKEDNNE